MHISCKNLTKKYGEKIAVNDISLDIIPGKILALLGPNGAGKSTLIKMLTGQLRPSSGNISIDEQEYDTFPVERRWELGIMPQDIVVWDDLNIQENLEFSASIYKLPASQTKARITQIIEDLRLQPEINTLAKNLSGGYKRRLNLAISIIHDPKVIFLDEPTPGIDAQSRILLTDYIQRLAETGKYSILLTDHYLEEAEKLADYVAIVDSGEVITEGTVSQLKAKHGQGNLLQVHLNPQTLGDNQGIIELFAKSFENPKMVKETVTMLVSDQAKSLTTALEIIQKNQLDILNINIKEPSLEDIFLLLTGKEVRE